MRLIGKLFNILFDKNLPPSTAEDKKLAAEIKAKFSNLPCLATDKGLISEQEWLDNINRLKELVFEGDLREFLRWDIIRSTMVVVNAPYILTEFNYLKKLPEWEALWQTAVKETSVGHPIRFWMYPNSSENLIHHAYHVAQFEAKTNLNINKIDYIFEFGGGYGSLSRLIFNLGFKGKYVIYDFPAFSFLQQYFLRSIGIKVHPIESFATVKNGLFCVSDVEQLKNILLNIGMYNNTLFIATWSISETPLDVRNTILALTQPISNYLIAYQNQFAEVNNIQYFEKWKACHKNIEWHNWEIGHLRQNYYLIGKAMSNH